MASTAGVKMGVGVMGKLGPARVVNGCWCMGVLVMVGGVCVY